MIRERSLYFVSSVFSVIHVCMKFGSWKFPLLSFVIHVRTLYLGNFPFVICDLYADFENLLVLCVDQVLQLGNVFVICAILWTLNSENILCVKFVPWKCFCFPNFQLSVIWKWLLNFTYFMIYVQSVHFEIFHFCNLHRLRLMRYILCSYVLKWGNSWLSIFSRLKNNRI